MALIKTKVASNGVEYNYWVARCVANVQNSLTTIEMVPFLSKAKRDEGCSHVAGIINVGTIEGKFVTGEEAYSKAKSFVTSTIPAETAEDDDVEVLSSFVHNL